MNKQNIYFYLSLIFAVWFALTAYFWSYYANLFISLPFGILSLVLWRAGKRIDVRKDRYRAIPVILIIGVIISIIVLIYFLIFE